MIGWQIHGFATPISVRPSPIDFKWVKRDLGKTIDTCAAYITTNYQIMNGYPEVWKLGYSLGKWWRHTVVTGSRYCCYAPVLHWFCAVIGTTVGSVRSWFKTGKLCNGVLWRITLSANMTLTREIPYNYCICNILKLAVTQKKVRWLPSSVRPTLIFEIRKRV